MLKIRTYRCSRLRHLRRNQFHRSQSPGPSRDRELHNLAPNHPARRLRALKGLQLLQLLSRGHQTPPQIWDQQTKCDQLVPLVSLQSHLEQPRQILTVLARKVLPNVRLRRLGRVNQLRRPVVALEQAFETASKMLKQELIWQRRRALLGQCQRQPGLPSPKP